MADEQIPFFILERGILDSSIMELELRSRWLMVVLIEIGSEPGKHGRIDMTLPVLARRARMSDDDTRAAIDELSAPDPQSRSSLEDGRRIVPLDPNRKWGWRLVNYQAKDEARKRLLAAARAERYRASRRVTTRDATSRDMTPSHDTEMETEMEKRNTGEGTGRGGVGTGQAEGFPEFWALYPKKAGKLDAEKAWRKLSAPECEKAIRMVRLYAKAVADKEPGLIKNPQGWLNGKRFNDDPSSWSSGNGKDHPPSQTYADPEAVKRALEKRAKWEAEHATPSQNTQGLDTGKS